MPKRQSFHRVRFLRGCSLGESTPSRSSAEGLEDHAEAHGRCLSYNNRSGVVEPVEGVGFGDESVTNAVHGVSRLVTPKHASLRLTLLSLQVVVLMESGGGEVTAFGLAAAKLTRLKDTGFKLTVCVDKV